MQSIDHPGQVPFVGIDFLKEQEHANGKFTRNGIPEYEFIKLMAMDYTKPFSINYLLTKMSFDEAKTMRHLFYKWMSSAGYVNATMYIDERIFNSLISCIDTKVLVNPVDPTKIQLDLAKVQLWKDSITYIGTNVGSRIVVIPNPIQRNLDIFENNN